MLGIETGSEIKLTSGEVLDAHKDLIKDAADVGFALSQEQVPQDRGTLQQSGFNPEWRGDKLVWGYTANHAQPQEFGTRPFQPPIEPLLEWSRRVTGGESLGWYVATKKIPEEGVDASPYVRPGVVRMKNWLDSHGVEYE